MSKSKRKSRPVKPRAPTKFGYIETCGLVLAHTEQKKNPNRKITAADHRKKCNHAGCDYCPKSDCFEWFHQHEMKGLLVGDRTIDFLLVWKDLPVHSNAVSSYCEFLAATECFLGELKRGALGRVLLGALKTEVNPPPKGEAGRFQPHVHVCLLMPDGWRTIREYEAILRARGIWRRLGGKTAKRREKEPKTLKGALNYMSKHPLSKYKTDGKRLLHDLVFNAVEMKRKRPAYIRQFWGKLTGQKFTKLRARASYRFRLPLMTLKQRASDPDRHYQSIFPVIRRLRYFEECPVCSLNTRAPKDCGEPFVCKNNHSWHARSVFGNKIESARLRKARNKILREYKHYGTVAAVLNLPGQDKDFALMVIRDDHPDAIDSLNTTK